MNNTKTSFLSYVDRCYSAVLCAHSIAFCGYVRTAHKAEFVTPFFELEKMIKAQEKRIIVLEAKVNESNYLKSWYDSPF